LAKQNNGARLVGGLRYKSAETSKEAVKVTMPTSQQLRILAVRAAIPVRRKIVVSSELRDV
jgi:hypothetical protein